MARIEIPVDANIDTAGLDAQVQKIAQEFNAIGEAIAKANNIKFAPVTTAAIADVQKLTSNYKELLKLQGGMRDRMKATGQSGSSFGDLDFDRMYSDPVQAHRARINAYRRVTHNTPFSLGSYDVIPQQRASSNGSNSGPQERQQPRQERWSSPIPGRFINSALRGAGPVGGVAAGALDAGVSAGGGGGLMMGLGAGLGGLFGGLAALGIGKLVSGVSAKVGDAQQEAISTDTLKRQLGDVGVDFVSLRERTRAVADAMGMTFAESHKLTAEFAKITGVGGRGLAMEVTNAAGFGRSFGLDSSVSTQFFARARVSGATSNDTDSKRLALNIAEAMGRSGSPVSRIDEVLHAVASFSEQVAASSLTRGNTSAYLGSMTGLMGSGLPGMTPAAAGALLGRANSALASGGAAGEAGQNFLYRSMNADRKLSPFEAKLMQEGGMFATRTGILGKGTLYNQYTGKSFEGGATVFDSIRSQLGASYKDSGLRAMALAGLTGLNNSQSMAMSKFAGEAGGEGRIGKLADLLKSKGIDISTVNAGGMGALSAISGGNIDVLKAQAVSLRGRSGIDALSDKENRRLDTAMEGAGKPGGQEELRQVLQVLTATHDQEKTEGTQTRDSINAMSNLSQRAATTLIGPINTMRDSLIYLAGDKKMGAAGITEAVRKIEHQERLSKIDSEYNATASGNAGDILLLKNQKNALVRDRQDAQGAQSKLTPDEKMAMAKKSVEAERALDAQIKDSEGKQQDAVSNVIKQKNAENKDYSLTRGIRNKNALNIVNGPSQWQGQTGSDGRFAVFDTPENGLRAAAKNLLAKFNRGNNTVNGLIEEWAPASENGVAKTAAYQKTVSDAMGVKGKDRINLRDPKTLGAMLRGQDKGENGKENYPAAMYLAAANAGIGSTPMPEGAPVDSVRTAPSKPATQNVNVTVSADDLSVMIDRQERKVPLRATVNKPGAQGTVQ